MAGKGAKPSECERRIKDILDGNAEAYVRWADMQVQGLQRNREYLKKQVRVAEQRFAPAQSAPAHPKHRNTSHTKHS
eukprot:847210-Prymnesium_polylepis.1